MLKKIAGLILGVIILKCASEELAPLEPALEEIEKCYLKAVLLDTVHSSNNSNNSPAKMKKYKEDLKAELQDLYDKQVKKEEEYFEFADIETYNRVIECYEDLDGCTMSTYIARLARCKKKLYED